MSDGSKYYNTHEPVLPCYGEEANILNSLSLQLKTKDIIMVTEIITQQHIYFVTLLDY